MANKNKPAEEVSVGDAISILASDLTATQGTLEQITQREPSFESIQPLNLYQIKPPLYEKFKPNPIKEIIQNILDDKLRGRTYTSTEAKQWTIEIANEINVKVKDLKMKRYKHIVQVIIGELKGAGVKCGVRCLWDSESDGYTSDMFMNDTLFCVVVVFAIYLY